MRLDSVHVALPTSIAVHSYLLRLPSHGPRSSFEIVNRKSAVPLLPTHRHHVLARLANTLTLSSEVCDPLSPSAFPHAKSFRSAHATESSSLRPSMAARPSSANNLLMSPSDIVGPSPVTSVGTEVTEIEDEMSPEVQSESSKSNPDTNSQVSSRRPGVL